MRSFKPSDLTTLECVGASEVTRHCWMPQRGWSTLAKSHKAKRLFGLERQRGAQEPEAW